MALLKVYGNNPTAGGTDGTAISESGTMTNPLTATLTVTESDAATAIVQCALRCDTGYETSGSFTLKLVDAESKGQYTGDALALAMTSDAESWSASLDFNEVVGATNILFFVKFYAAAGTTPTTDTSVQLMHDATVVASV